ncbi:MAG: hypothetical protein GOVbin1807_1 [Prokaryotic dsDNA virus sp.]|nr:MAG: hypothetical protein GOVbin1807_1 [Prokaryotic dsDNA virus sp.]|tara:strand:+ start:1499 stop:1702 length:204 start_codon:yes stop_codon:yes gene_type:complete
MTKLNIRIGSLLQWQGITQCRGELGIVIGLLNGNGYDGFVVHWSVDGEIVDYVNDEAISNLMEVLCR